MTDNYTITVQDDAQPPKTLLMVADVPIFTGLEMVRELLSDGEVWRRIMGVSLNVRITPNATF
jgi:hypothetical protein